MGTRRSRHNKGRKPRYKDHRRNLATESKAERQANFRLVNEVKSLRPQDVADLNADDCYDAFKALRWGWEDGRPVCPCGSESIYEYSSRKIFKCARCGRQFSITSGTIFHARKLSHGEILTALSTTIHDPANPHRLSLDMGINYRSAVRLVKNFRLFVGNIQTKTTDARWPYLSDEPETEVEKMMARVAAKIPSEIPEQVRADVGQEMVIGIIAGDFSEDQLLQQLRRYISGHYKAVEFNKFRDMSLDQPVPGTDKMSWYEVINGSTLAEGRIDRQSEWMFGRYQATQDDDVYVREIADYAAENGWAFNEAKDFLQDA